MDLTDTNCNCDANVKDLWSSSMFVGHWVFDDDNSKYFWPACPAVACSEYEYADCPQYCEKGADGSTCQDQVGPPTPAPTPVALLACAGDADTFKTSGFFGKACSEYTASDAWCKHDSGVQD